MRADPCTSTFFITETGEGQDIAVEQRYHDKLSKSQQNLFTPSVSKVRSDENERIYLFFSKQNPGKYSLTNDHQPQHVSYIGLLVLCRISLHHSLLRGLKLTHIKVFKLDYKKRENKWLLHSLQPC